MRRLPIAAILIGLAILLISSAIVAYQSTVDDCSVDSLFVSPAVDGVIQDAIAELISNANESLSIALFSFTDDRLGNLVVEAFQRELDVRVFLDDSQDNLGSGGVEYPKLIEAGIPVKVEFGTGLMHHKFMVVDGQTVLTGSYNWSAAADDNNYENAVVIECGGVAEAFQSEFDFLWGRF